MKNLSQIFHQFVPSRRRRAAAVRRDQAAGPLSGTRVRHSERLEDRTLLTVSVIARETFTVPMGGTSDLTLNVPASNGSEPTVFGIRIERDSSTSSTLNPSAMTVTVRGTGAEVPVMSSQPNVDGGTASIILVSLTPDEYTITVGGDQGTSGEAIAEIFLPGDVGNDGNVDERDGQQARLANMQQTTGVTFVGASFFRQLGFDPNEDQATAALDVDQDGDIDRFDVEVVEMNITAPAITLGANGMATEVTLVGDEDAPVITLAIPNDTGRSDMDGVTNDLSFDITIDDISPIVVFEGAVNGEDFVDLTGLIDPMGGMFSLDEAAIDSTFGTTVRDSGPRTLTLRATDEIGNETGDLVFNFELDGTAPDAPIDLDLNDASDSGAMNDDDLTNDNTPTIDGDAEDNAIVRLSSDREGAEVGMTTVNSPFSITTSMLQDGVHNLTATAEDLAGNVSDPSDPLTITIDTAAPVIGAFDLDPSTDTAPTGDQLTEMTPVDFDGMTEANASVELLDGMMMSIAGPVIASDPAGLFEFNGIAVPFVAGGGTVFTARATDAAGNSGTASQTIVRNVAPTVSMAMDNRMFDENGAAQMIDLTTIFADVNIVEGDSLTITIETNSSIVQGSLSGTGTPGFSATMLTLTPQADQNGMATVVVRATDTHGETVDFTVNADVRSINDAPVVTAPGSALSATEDIALNIHGAGFTVADVDAGAGTVSATLMVGEGTLSVVAGDSGVSVDSGDGTGTVMLSGTITQVDDLLTGNSTGTVTYATVQAPSANTTLTVTVNDNGNTGDDPGLTGDATSEEGTNNVTINITAINDAPVVGAPVSALAATEDVPLSIEGTGFTVADVDAGSATLTATISAGEGTLTVSAGDSGATVTGGDGTGTVTVTGTAAQLDALLMGSGSGTITYNTTQAPSANTMISVTVNDGGATGDDPGLTGDGTSEEGTNSVTVNITAINDGPVVDGPASALAATEDTSLNIDGAGFTVSDADSGSAVITATLNVGEGTLSVSAGDSGTTVTGGNGTDMVTVTGTVAQLDNLLTGAGSGSITYDATQDPSANTMLTVTVNDGGASGDDPGLTGDGTSEEDMASVQINITALNDAPVVTAPGGDLAATEDIALNIHGTGFGVTDADSGSAVLTATLTVGDGTLTVTAGDSGATVMSGDGTGMVTVTGTAAQLNDLLTAAGSGTIVYATSQAPPANTMLSVTVNDGGASGDDPGLTGDGTSEEGTNSVTINITDINDGPVVSGPGSALAATEDTPLNIHGTGFTVMDVDSGSAVITATIAVGEGSVTVSAGDSGTTVTGGNGTGSVTVTGTVTQLDALLTGGGSGTIAYDTTQNPSANTMLTVTVNDGGNTGDDPGLTGDGTSEEDMASVQINITAINDAPVVTAPGANLSATEDVALSIEGTGFGVTDADSGMAVLTATLMVGEGSLNVSAGDSGATVTGGNDSGNVTVTGTAAQLNDLLTGAGSGTITYATVQAPSANTVLTVTVNDGGASGDDPGLTGDGTSEEGTNNVTIDITAINDAPVVGAPGSALAATEDIALSIEGTGFTVADVDAGTATLTATISVGEGTLDVVAGDSGATVTGGDGTDSVTVTGTAAQLDALLTAAGSGTITYNTTQAPSANTMLTVTVNDGGATGDDPGLTGDGSSEEGTNSVQINITAINDGPVVNGPGSALAATEDTPLTIDGTGFTVTDADSGTAVITATLAVGEGTLNVSVGDSGTTVTGGNDTGMVTVTGTVAQLDNLLTGAGSGAIVYATTQDPSANTMLTVTVNDGGASGDDPGLTADGSSEEGMAAVQINITAINDAPVVTAPGSALAATEDIALDIHGAGFGVTDADSGNAVLTATLMVGEGTLNVTVGDSGATVMSGDGTGTVTVTGTAAQLNNLLTDGGSGTITYSTTQAPSDSTMLSVTVNDGGASGQDPNLTGGANDEEGTASVTINITDINDAPVVGAPGAALEATEDTSLNIHGAGFTVADADSGTAVLTATISVGEGTLSVSAGDSGATVTGGDGTGSVTVTGTAAQLDSLLTGGGSGTIAYDTTQAPSANTMLSVTVNDGGATGDDPGLTGDGTSEEGMASVQINITAINDAPVVNGPGSNLSATEDVDLDIHSTGFSVTDIDSASGTLTATLNVGEGSISVTVGDSGTTVTGGNDTGNVTVTGTVTQLDNLLTGGGSGTITYAATQAPSANTTLTVTVNDGGNTGDDPGLTGDGTSEEGMASVTIDITAINDAPVVGAPGSALAATEDIALNIHGAGFTVADADSGTNALNATLTVGEGFLTVTAGDSGVTVDSGSGTGTVNLTGTAAQLDDLLTGGGSGTITYDATQDPSAMTTLTVTVNDNGFSGDDPGLSGDEDDEEGTNSVTINITAVNDDPVAVTDMLTALNQNVFTTLQVLNNDTDVDNTVPDDLTITNVVPVSALAGSVINISGDMKTLMYRPDASLQDADGVGTVETFDYTIIDGAGGMATGRLEVELIENTLPSIDIAVPDEMRVEDGDDFMIDLTGRYSDAEDGTNLTITVSNNTDPSLVTVMQDGLMLTLDLQDDANGMADITIRIEDSQAGVALDIFRVTVDAVNDTPVVNSPGSALAATEDTPLDIHGAGFTVTDVDSDTTDITATLMVGEGVLNVTAGDSGVSIMSGNGSGTVTLTGTVAELDNLLTDGGSGTITYDATQNPSANTTLTVTVDDGGATGEDPGLTGGDNNEVDSANVMINITARNDAPVVGAPGSNLSATEDTSLDIHGAGFSIADIDAGTATLTATLTVGEGVLNVSAGDSGASVTSGDGTGMVTVTGTVTQLDNLLTGGGSGTITYDASQDPSANTVLTVTVNDGGATGEDPGVSGGDNDEEGTNNVTIDITARNDAPVVSAPGANLSATEDTSLDIHGAGFSVADIDAGTATLTATLTVGEGVLNVSAGNSGASVTSGDGTGLVTVTGTVAQLDNLLTGGGSGTITYDASQDPSANTVLTVTVNDGGATGEDPGVSGGDNDEEGTNNVTIDITARNDAPVVTPPGSALSATEDTSFNVHGAGFSVADVDAGSAVLTATLTVGEGVLNVTAGDSGATVTGGDGTGMVTVTGTVAQLDNLLTDGGSGTITYTATQNPSANTMLTVAVNDGGATGEDPGVSGGDNDEEGSAAVQINITARNDAPVVGAPGSALDATEDTSLNIHGEGFTVADVDAGSAVLTATLTAGEGAINVSVGNSGATVTGGNGSDSVTVTGTTAEIDNLLTGGGTGTITYDATQNPSANTTFTVTVNDGGATGEDPGVSGGDNDEEGTNNVTINITARNDAPVVTGPVGNLDATEDTTLELSGTGFGVTDVDSQAGNLTATINVVEGTVTVTPGDSDTTVTGGNGTGTVMVTGTATQLNDLLTGAGSGTIGYDAIQDPSANTVVTVTVNDGGATGEDPGLSGTGTDEEGSANATIDITAQNDAPVVTLPAGPVPATENVALSLTNAAISVNDVDDSGGVLTVTLMVDEGTLTIDVGDSGVTLTSGNNIGTLTGTGTAAQIQAFARGETSGTLFYNTVEAPSATATFTVTVNDGGQTGNDPGLTGGDNDEEGSASLMINITAVNDAPVVTAPGSNLSATEDINEAIHGTGFSVTDVDSGTAMVTATLTVGDGTLTIGAGTTGVGVANDGTGSVTVTGTVAQVNDLLTGANGGTITYATSQNPPVQTTLTVTVNDGGASGDDPGLSGTGTDEEGSASVTIDITPVNDPPRLVGALGDLIRNDGANDDVIDLTGLFVDPEGDAFTLSVAVTQPEFFNADGGNPPFAGERPLITANVESGTDLRITYEAYESLQNRDQATVSVTATEDGSMLASPDTDDFTVDVVGATSGTPIDTFQYFIVLTSTETVGATRTLAEGLPASLTSVEVGETFFAEVWFRDLLDTTFITNEGLDLMASQASETVTAAAVNVLFDATAGQVLATDITNADDDQTHPFAGTEFAQPPEVDNVNGIVRDIGQGTLFFGAPPIVGINGFARVGTIQFMADVADVTQTFTVSVDSRQGRTGAGSKLGTTVRANDTDATIAGRIHPSQFAPFTVDLDQTAALQTGTETADSADVPDTPTVFTAIVAEPTTIAPDGTAPSLPDSADWIHEWDSFAVEVWGTAGGGSLDAAAFDLDYNSDYFTATGADYGRSYFGAGQADITEAVIDDASGIVSGLSGQIESEAGSDNYILLGRVHFESTGTDGVKASGAPVDHGIGLASVSLTVDGSEITPDVIDGAGDTELWSVAYDFDDDGIIGFSDIPGFSAAFSQSIASADSPFVAIADFDRSGVVSFEDVSWFAQNIGVARSNADDLTFPSNFDDRWTGAALVSDGLNSLTTVFDAALQSWDDALDVELPEIQLVVADLPGAQLGLGRVVSVGQDGLPDFGRVTIDSDAAGLGWYTGLDAAPPDGGSYDLLTVLTHEIGHAIGFGTAFAGYSNSIVETPDGTSVFVTSLGDSIALDATAEHLDPEVYPNDLMVAFISPGIRRSISALDVQIIESSYAAAESGDSVVHSEDAHLFGADPLDDDLVDDAFAEWQPVE